MLIKVDVKSIEIPKEKMLLIHLIKTINITPPWNKGLSKEIDTRVKKYGETYTNRIKEGVITPAFKGKTHTPDTKQKMSESAKKMF